MCPVLAQYRGPLSLCAFHGMGEIADDLKAAWHILREFQTLGPRELNSNKAPAVGPIEDRELEGCMAYSSGIPDLGAQKVER